MSQMIPITHAPNTIKMTVKSSNEITIGAVSGTKSSGSVPLHSSSPNTCPARVD